MFWCFFTKMIRVGIDQGKNGCVCIYDDSAKTAYFYNICDKDDDSVQYPRMVDLLTKAIVYPRRILINIEQLAVFPGQSRSNAIFSMGRTQGITEAAIKTFIQICENKKLPVEAEWWAPSRWKRIMGLIKKDKNASKELAYAKANLLGVSLPSRMRHDCAEAFLIAML